MTSIHASSSQGPERWETETDDEEDVGMGQIEELVPDLKDEEEETEVGKNWCSDFDGFGDNAMTVMR